ncbi:MAG: hypothetical protein ACI8Q1_001788 [Parvicella sp.]|jgi:hypothetical protein
MTTITINIPELNEHTLAILQLLRTDASIEVIEDDLDKKALIDQAKKAEIAYRNGETISQDDLKLETRSW